jgi:hypothetical protein
MANYKRSVKKSVEAWRAMEAALADMQSFEDCQKWVVANPEICKHLTGAGLLAVMDEDLKKKA